MGVLTALVCAIVVAAVLQGSVFGPRREQESPLASVWQCLALLATLLIVVGLAAAIAELRGPGQAAALGALAVVIVLAGWWVLRVQSSEGVRADRVPVDRWRKAGMGVQPSAGVVEFQPGQTCPLCHVEHKPTSEAAQCPSCRTLFHLQCVLEMGRCSTLGCAGAPQRVDAIEEGRSPARDRRPDPD